MININWIRHLQALQVSNPEADLLKNVHKKPPQCIWTLQDVSGGGSIMICWLIHTRLTRSAFLNWTFQRIWFQSWCSPSLAVKVCSLVVHEGAICMNSAAINSNCDVYFKPFGKHLYKNSRWIKLLFFLLMGYVFKLWHDKAQREKFINQIKINDELKVVYIYIKMSVTLFTVP